MPCVATKSEHGVAIAAYTLHSRHSFYSAHAATRSDPRHEYWIGSVVGVTSFHVCVFLLPVFTSWPKPEWARRMRSIDAAVSASALQPVSDGPASTTSSSTTPLNGENWPSVSIQSCHGTRSLGSASCGPPLRVVLSWRGAPSEWGCGRLEASGQLWRPYDELLWPSHTDEGGRGGSELLRQAAASAQPLTPDPGDGCKAASTPGPAAAFLL